jgi:hypothetical protein
VPVRCNAWFYEDGRRNLGKALRPVAGEVVKLCLYPVLVNRFRFSRHVIHEQVLA